ncbi:MAG: hypothetical protein K8R02_02110 [Anaerohalosphaeraceae bacterium]|nr:hypothetical protein [Anaerohalosphaeraceae bacterium]
MLEDTTDMGLEKAKPFFSRAGDVAATDNFDYAIDMFIEGLKRAPDALELGHKPLRHNALVRQGKKGKKPSIIDKVKHARGKDPLENMLNAEYLLAKDPDNLNYAEQMLKAAIAGDYNDTALWIANLIFEANKASDKPSLQTFLLLKDSYTKMEQYSQAVNACGWATKIRPDDAALADELRDLSANLAVQNGKYDQDGDFTKSIKDRDSQQKLQAQQGTIKSIDFRQGQIEETKIKVEANPSQQNILKLADLLAELGNSQSDEEAIGLLENQYASSRDFTYKRRAGEINLRSLRRHIRKAKAAAEAKPTDSDAKNRFKKATKALFAAELTHYKLCLESYPTDLKLKYEYGVRLMRNQKYDQAIPFLQDSRKEPRHKINAMNKIGLCFFMKGWFNDAIDTFAEAIESYEIKDNDTAKDLRYNLARAYEQQGKSEDALAIYSKLAQLDFGFKDVRARIDRLRNGSEQ